MTKNRNGLLLLAGDGFSAFGTWIDSFDILTIAAYQFQVTPYQVAVVSAAGLLPGILAGPAGIPPSSVHLLGAVSIPVSAQLVLAFAAARANWLPILLLGLLALGFEWASAQLASFLPNWIGISSEIVLLVIFIGWSFTIMYTESARALHISSNKREG
jgi:hypothetical protein